MVGIIVFLAIVVFIICAAINDKKKQEEAAQKEAQKKAQKAQETREFEQQTAQQIQTAASKISDSLFYKELRSYLNARIQKDMKEYLFEKYNEYLKTPNALPSKFNPFSGWTYLYDAVGNIVITPAGICYSHGLITVPLSAYQGKIQFSCANHGYSNLDAIQMWVLAQRLAEDFGYQLVNYRNACRYPKWSCEKSPNTLKDAVDYLHMTQKYSQIPSDQGGKEPIYIDLLPLAGTAYFNHLIRSEIYSLQNSAISYKSPF